MPGRPVREQERPMMLLQQRYTFKQPEKSEALRSNTRLPVADRRISRALGKPIADNDQRKRGDVDFLQ
jgi:hypothetical protein